MTYFKMNCLEFDSQVINKHPFSVPPPHPREQYPQVRAVPYVIPVGAPFLTPTASSQLEEHCEWLRNFERDIGAILSGSLSKNATAAAGDKPITGADVASLYP